MHHFIPGTMQEVQQKLQWSLEQGQDITEHEIILQAIKENTQRMADAALEGAYWTVRWEEMDQQLGVYNIFREKIAVLTPTKTTFSEEFKQNALETLRLLDVAVNRLANEQ